MTNDRRSLTDRIKASPWAGFVGFGLIAAIPLWLSLGSLLPTVNAIASSAPLAALSPGDAVGIPIAIAAFALGQLSWFMPKEKPTKPSRAKQRPRRQKVNGPVVCFGVVAVSLACVPVAPTIARYAVSHIATAHGYVACPAPQGLRHLTYNWIRSASGGSHTDCPKPN